MTASLDRAVEAAWMAHTGRDKLGPDYARDYEQMLPSERAEMLTILTAALPHLGVDREALRGLAEKWRNSAFEGYQTGIPHIDEATANRVSAKEECADDLIHLIENQPGGDAVSFEAWFKKTDGATIRAMPWIKDELREAFIAGQKYEKQLAAKREEKGHAR